MKSYYFHHEEQQRGAAETITGKTDLAGKKWKTFFAVLALIGAAYLIIKLKQSEGNTPVLQTVNMPLKTSQKFKEEVRKKETVNPISCLKVKMNWRRNLIGETVLEGTLHNTATAANFKDPVLLVTWLSKTNTAIGTNRYPLYKYLAAAQTIQYKLKVKAPSKIGDIKVSVESATAIQ